MKKSIIALMGLFTLIACSEDSYQEADKMSETGTVENSSGGMQANSIDPAIPYESPYGTTDRFTYVFQNDTDLEWKFVTWVQFCFFDGANNSHHHGQPLASFPYYSTFMVWPNWNEYTLQYGTQMITIPPHTTETIFMNNGKILPVDASGPTTASGQFFNLQTANMPMLTPKDLDFFGKYLKVVGFEGYASHPITGGGGNTTLRFPLGPEFSASSTPTSGWLTVPTMWSPFDQKVYNVVSKEICVTNSFSGSIGSRPSFVNFTAGGINYTCSAYTTKDKVVFKLQ